MFYESFASKAAYIKLILHVGHVTMYFRRSGEDGTGNLLVQKHAAAKKFRKSDEKLPLF